MTVGAELTLFIIVGAISILAAVMMLISENAVHSALFLILNFACVSFMYLMLNAPFLFAVQITVYAGAIMVLFLFVIMLLGAERLMPQAEPRFRWLAPATLGLTVVLLLLAGIAIVQSDIDAAEPEPAKPVFRFVHAAAGAEAVDVYLDGQRAISDLAYQKASDYQAWPAGGYTALVVPRNAEPVQANALLETPVFLAADNVLSYVLMPDPSNGQLQALPVNGSLSPVEDENTARLVVVHAVPCAAGQTGCPLDIADISIPSDDPEVLITNLDYGNISAVKVLKEGDYVLGAFSAGAIDAALDAREDEDEAILDTLDPILRLEERTIEDNTSLLWVVTADTTATTPRGRVLFFATDNHPAFGSATGIGQLLFTKYMLPFQIIAVLLLVSMIGVIVLTKQYEAPHRPRARRRLANVPGNPTVDEYLRSLQGKPADSGD